MYATVKSRIQKAERHLRKRMGHDISTPSGRRRAWFAFHMFDHGFLRIVWWNFYEIVPGVWRSNQPSPGRLKRYHRMGIISVINLRGAVQQSPILFEREACAKLGLDLYDITLSARKLVPREEMLRLIELMRTVQKPFVLHCKSGADRAGFAAAIYLAVIEGQPIATARRQLHWRYFHLRSTETGILDHVFDIYEADAKVDPMDFETWLHQKYDHEALTESWKLRRA